MAALCAAVAGQPRMACGYVLIIGFAVAVVLLKLGPLLKLRAGDLVRVAIPRTAERPLATGTRLDVAAALEKAGESRAEVSALLQAGDDAELLRRYWRIKDAEPKVDAR